MRLVFLFPLIPWWLLLCILCGFSSAFLSCSEEVRPGTDPIPYELQPTNTLFNAEIHLLDSTITKARVVAGRIRWFPSLQQTFLDRNVHVDFFSISGRRAAQLWCDSAKIDNATNNMWAFGNVRVLSDSTGTMLETSSLHWNNARRRLSTNAFVRIERPGEVVEGGYGFESDEYLKHYTIFHVRGNIIP
ncbi:MAG: LPS export ABC transporter periplasmic protein LptC [Bacteroidota bacterium]|nr:LPS export ABC transporter periplasmic protein LptC [Candidatus Kapabacteria bacterium]MDW8074466.1 LPS export ABC transporter periplasmic protein LptC [Bacteroidota bacterium]